MYKNVNLLLIVVKLLKIIKMFSDVDKWEINIYFIKNTNK